MAMFHQGQQYMTQQLVICTIYPAEDEKVASQGKTAPESLFYMKQTISNACGTIAILHGLCNNTTDITPGE
jgi:hypothetical protein